ncbi:hypothetical protein KEM56_005277 [Ascosphaera pollenicola]|nr:hypothetical protein KEM56_005277 [Ascosphaera pollenicola]
MLAFDVFPWDIWLTIIDHLEDARDVQSLFRASRQLVPLKEGYGFKVMVKKAIAFGHYDIGVEIRNIIGAILSGNWEVFTLLAPHCSSMRFEVADSRLPSVITRYGLKPSNVYYSRLNYGYASPIQLLCAMFSKTKAANDLLIWTLVQGLTGYLPGFVPNTAPYQDLLEAADKRDLPLMEALLDFNKQLRDHDDVVDKALADFLERAVKNKDMEALRFVSRKESSRISEGIQIRAKRWNSLLLWVASTSTEMFEVILPKQEQPHQYFNRGDLLRARADSSTEMLELLIRRGEEVNGRFLEDCLRHMDRDTPFLQILLPRLRMKSKWDRRSLVELMSAYDVLVKPALDAFPGILMEELPNGESALAQIYNFEDADQSAVLKIIEHDPAVFERMGHKVLPRIARRFRGHAEVLRLALSDFMKRKEEVPKGDKTRMLNTILCCGRGAAGDAVRACVGLLLEWGANPNAYYCGQTLLMKACRFRDVEIVVMLISAGADVNASMKDHADGNRDGLLGWDAALEYTSLQWPCLEVALALLSAGAIVPGVEDGSFIKALTRKIQYFPGTGTYNSRIDQTARETQRHEVDQQSRIMVEILKRHPSLAHILFEPKVVRDEEDDVVMQDECEVGNTNLVNAIVAVLLQEIGRWSGGLRCCLLVGGILLGADNLSEDKLGVWSCGDMMSALLYLLKELVFRHKVNTTLRNRDGLTPIQHVIKCAETLIHPESWQIVIAAMERTSVDNAIRSKCPLFVMGQAIPPTSCRCNRTK